MDVIIAQSVQFMLASMGGPPRIGHDASGDASKPRGHDFSILSISEQHLFQLFLGHPARIRDFVGVWVDLNVCLHHNDVVQFSLDPFFIHPGCVTHLCHEDHVLGVDLLRAHSQLLFHFPHRSAFDTHGVGFIQFGGFVKWVRAACVGPDPGERDFVN